MRVSGIARLWTIVEPIGRWLRDWAGKIVQFLADRTVEGLSPGRAKPSSFLRRTRQHFAEPALEPLGLNPSSNKSSKNCLVFSSPRAPRPRGREMTIDFYYVPFSPPCRMVMMLAKALGVHLNLKFLDTSKGEHRTPEFTKVFKRKLSRTEVLRSRLIWIFLLLFFRQQSRVPRVSD